MANTVKVKAHKYVLGTGAATRQGYHFYVTPARTLSEGEFMQLVADRMGTTKEIAEAWYKGTMRSIIEQMLEGNSVNTGFLLGKLQVEGSTDSADGQPAKGSVKGVLNFTGDVKAAFAALVAVNDTKMVEASLLTLQQEGVAELNKITAADTNIYCSGNRVYTPDDREDEGVYLYKGNGLLFKCELVSSSTTSIVFKIPEGSLPEDGQYKVVILTRNGENPDEYTVATLTRNVTIEAAA